MVFVAIITFICVVIILPVNYQGIFESFFSTGIMAHAFSFLCLSD
jgi:hypothetical protein